MKLRGTIEIAAPARAVWDLIVDPVSLSACVPGVREVRQVDERTFEGTITAAIGPMEGDFSFASVLEQADFPGDVVVRVHGTDSVTKSRLEAHVRVALAPGETGGTVLSYDAVVSVKGRLAILGEMVLRATASLMIAQVTRCLRAQLESPTADRER